MPSPTGDATRVATQVESSGAATGSTLTADSKAAAVAQFPNSKTMPSPPPQARAAQSVSVPAFLVDVPTSERGGLPASPGERSSALSSDPASLPSMPILSANGLSNQEESKASDMKKAAPGSSFSASLPRDLSTNSNALPAPSGTMALDSNARHDLPEAEDAQPPRGGAAKVELPTGLPAKGPFQSAGTAAAPSKPPAANGDQRMKMESPHIVVELTGPADLPVGTPANYAIVVTNTDAIDLRGLILRMDVPVGIAVQSLKPSHGEFEVEHAADGATLLTWGFDQLASGQTASAPVQLVASRPQNFAVAMEWTLIPLTSSTEFDVLAPRLELALEGPSEVRFGEPNAYRLHVRNPGNASASNVAVTLTAGPYGSSTSEVGSIAAGGEQVIEVELIFNQKGPIAIAASAVAAGELSSDTDIEVLVRKPELQAKMSAPSLVYHGSPASYLVQLANSGDAVARDVVAKIKLPPQAEVLAKPAGAELVEGYLTWKIEELGIGKSLDFPVQLQLLQEGENLVEIVCEGTAGELANAAATTQLQSIADVKLLVNDPLSPAPVQGEVLYELTLTNRGSKAASNVRVVAQFSDGIEPTRGEGQPCRIIPGQLLFEPLTTLAAGESVQLQVFAEAATAGMHRFRAEVRMDESEARLVQEESTQYLDTVGKIAAPQANRVLR